MLARERRYKSGPAFARVVGTVVIGVRLRRADRTVQAVVIGGVSVPESADLMRMFGAAKRDPSVFPDPDRFDIQRANAQEHLSFGSGPHFCLGAPLARLEARVVLEVVSSRLPSLRLVDGARPVRAERVVPGTVVVAGRVAHLRRASNFTLEVLEGRWANHHSTGQYPA